MIINFETAKKLMNIGSVWGIGIQPGFNSAWGAALLYDLHRDGISSMERKFGDTNAKDYFVLRYFRHRINYLSVPYDEVSKGISEIIVPVPLTPKNLKNVVYFFMQQNQEDFGEYLPKNFDNTMFGAYTLPCFASVSNWESKNLILNQFNELSEKCFNHSKKSKALTVMMVRKIMSHIRKSISDGDVFESTPITSFLMALENNPAWTF